MVNSDPTLTQPDRVWARWRQEVRRAPEEAAAAARAVNKPDYRRTRSGAQQQHRRQSLLLADGPTLEPGNEDEPEASRATVRPSTVFALGAIAFAALAAVYTSLDDPSGDADASLTSGEVALPSAAAPNAVPAGASRPPTPSVHANVALPRKGGEGGMTAGGRAVKRADAADGPSPPATEKAAEEADAHDVATSSSADWLPGAHPHLRPVEAAILSDLADARKLRVGGQEEVEEDMPRSMNASTPPEHEPLVLVPVRKPAELSRAQPSSEHPQRQQAATARSSELQVTADATASAFTMPQERVSPEPGNAETDKLNQLVYRLQFASVTQEPAAHRAWTTFKRDFANLLARLDPVIEQAEVAGVTVYRVRAGSFPARPEAEAICRKLRDQGAECLVVAARS